MNPTESRFSLVPTESLERIENLQQKILQLLEKGFPQDSSLGEYITEKQAQQLLDRKATWFWQMRTAGKLKSAKVGSKVFYRKEDLLRLIQTSVPKS